MERTPVLELAAPSTEEDKQKLIRHHLEHRRASGLDVRRMRLWVVGGVSACVLLLLLVWISAFRVSLKNEAFDRSLLGPLKERTLRLQEDLRQQP